jgi:hypothetical protein
MRENTNAYLDDDDDVVADGESVRVPLFMRDHQPGYRGVSDAKVRDAQRMARDARQTWIRDLSSAWRTPHKDASEPDAAEARLRRHLRSEPDDDAQVRRDRAWKSYCDQLSTAWQTNPRRADEVERQRRQWTAEPMRGA